MNELQTIGAVEGETFSGWLGQVVHITNYESGPDMLSPGCAYFETEMQLPAVRGKEVPVTIYWRTDTKDSSSILAHIPLISWVPEEESFPVETEDLRNLVDSMASQDFFLEIFQTPQVIMGITQKKVKETDLDNWPSLIISTHITNSEDLQTVVDGIPYALAALYDDMVYSLHPVNAPVEI